MRKICVINQKGGVGKTTTVVNVASGLAEQNRKVLIIDLDPQGNISTCFTTRSEKDMYHLLVEGADYKECISSVNDYLDVITASETLEKASVILAGEPSRETVLKRALENVYEYDYVFIDCPPSLGILNQNALLYANEAFIPVSTDPLGVDALRKMELAIGKINDVFNHRLTITAIIPTMFDGRNKVCKDSLDIIKRGFNGVTTNVIRVNSKLKEAPGAGQSIFEYARSSNGRKDYQLLVDNVERVRFSG